MKKGEIKLLIGRLYKKIAALDAEEQQKADLKSIIKDLEEDIVCLEKMANELTLTMGKLEDALY
jgi:hypothetical protein